MKLWILLVLLYTGINAQEKQPTQWLLENLKANGRHVGEKDGTLMAWSVQDVAITDCTCTLRLEYLTKGSAMTSQYQYLLDFPLADLDPVRFQIRRNQVTKLTGKDDAMLDLFSKEGEKRIRRETAYTSSFSAPRTNVEMLKGFSLTFADYEFAAKVRNAFTQVVTDCQAKSKR